MKQEEILEIENQAWAEVPDDLRSGNYNRMLINFAAIIEAKTLERAATRIEDLHDAAFADQGNTPDAYDCAEAIRALKETK